jgi:hypothetical protein
MPELAQFQHEFAAGLNRQMPAATPMRVYLNTVMLGAVEALAANFPVCAQILGDRAFEANALAFARRYPPEVPVLALYGRGLGDWLAGQPIARELPYLADVARCEELHTAALHSADAQAIEPQVLEALPAEKLLTLKLRLHPATRFGWFETPAMAIWLAHQGDGFDELAPDWRPAGALFTRPETHVSGFELDSLGHRLLAGIRLGETLGGAAQAAAMLFPGADVGGCFGTLAAHGTFVATAR